MPQRTACWLASYALLSIRRAGVLGGGYHRHFLPQLQGASRAGAPVIVQYGEPRTGTTYQFQVLCASSCLRWGPGETECKVCKDTATLGLDVPVADIASGTVCKVHDISKAREIVRKRPTVLFTTATERSDDPQVRAAVLKRDWRAARRRLQQSWGLPIDYVQLFGLLGRRGHTLVFDYAPLLNLTDDQADALATYVRYWEILRRCCGAQMSTDYRHRLWDVGDRPVSAYNLPSNMITFRHVEDPAYDACEMYDIEQVERRYLETAVYRRCDIPLMSRLSDVDQPLDGTYCRRALNATIELHLRFNDPRYLSL